MTDSKLRDELEATRERNREKRLEQVKHWVQFIEEHPAAVWGPQQNDLIESQLQSARESGLDAEHYRRVERAGRRR